MSRCVFGLDTSPTLAPVLLTLGYECIWMFGGGWRGRWVRPGSHTACPGATGTTILVYCHQCVNVRAVMTLGYNFVWLFLSVFFPQACMGDVSLFYVCFRRLLIGGP